MSWAFIAQRITGIILLIYLLMHLTYLTSLTEREFYEKLTSITVSPRFLIFDILLVLAGVFHGVNGLRIIVHELGFAYEWRKVLIALTILITIAVWVYASFVMYRIVGGD
jgi:succinate dehydrogenase / fumarate reductase cytochrome b subunit